MFDLIFSKPCSEIVDFPCIIAIVLFYLLFSPFVLRIWFWWAKFLPCFIVIHLFVCQSLQKKWLISFDFFQSPRNNFFRFYGSVGSLYVCVYVFAIVATPLHPQFRNFGTTFLMWLSKSGFFFQFFEKLLLVFAELMPFFYFSWRFHCRFEEQLCKNQRS